MSESVVNENCLDKAFATMIEQSASIVITSYSIHYTKLYDLLLWQQLIVE